MQPSPAGKGSGWGIGTGARWSQSCSLSRQAGVRWEVMESIERDLLGAQSERQREGSEGNPAGDEDERQRWVQPLSMQPRVPTHSRSLRAAPRRCRAAFHTPCFAHSRMEETLPAPPADPPPLPPQSSSTGAPQPCFLPATRPRRAFLPPCSHGPPAPGGGESRGHDIKSPRFAAQLLSPQHSPTRGHGIAVLTAAHPAAVPPGRPLAAPRCPLIKTSLIL